jgi:adenylosuccinate synthase
LPDGAKRYLDYLAKQVGVEVGCISTGPERNETILLEGSRFQKLIG